MSSFGTGRKCRVDVELVIGSSSRFLKRVRSDLTRSLNKLKSEFGPT